MEDITIPKGYEARIEDNKVIFERKSEEEVIRKEIISLVRRYVLPEANCLVPGGCTTRKNAIAYLEKQKEQNSMWGDGLLPLNVKTLEHIYNVCKGCMKQMSKEEFVMCVMGTIPKELVWERTQKTAEWSEEDEEMIARICANLEYIAKEAGSDSEFKEKLEERIKWMKRLKPLCPQPGLSKEDFIKFGNREYERGRQDGIQFAERTRWKPSEEQREAVFHACNRMVGDRYHAAIYSLYNELKKLI